MPDAHTTDVRRAYLAEEVHKQFIRKQETIHAGRNTVAVTTRLAVAADEPILLY